MAAPLRKEATPVTFNTHTAWMLKLTLRELKDLSRHLVRNKDQDRPNRPVSPAHQTAIEKYLAENDDWVIDTVTLALPRGGVTQVSKTIQFDPATLRVLDGQHRVNALLNLLDRLEDHAPSDRSNRTQNRLTALMRDEIPVVIYEVADQAEQRYLYQLFSNRRPFDPGQPEPRSQQPEPLQQTLPEPTDVNNVLGPEPAASPVPARTGMSLRGLKNLASTLSIGGAKQAERAPDPFVASAQSAITNSAVLRDKVSTQRRPADAQAPFLTETNVRDIATTIQLGIARTPSYEDRVASSQPKNQEVLRQNIIEFFDTFLPTCLPNYEILADDQNFDNRLVTARSNSYALEPPVIRLIANTWARWTVDYDLDPTALAKHIGNLKMAKADPLNDIETSLNLLQGPRKRFQNHLHPNWQTATAKIIEDTMP